MDLPAFVRPLKDAAGKICHITIAKATEPPRELRGAIAGCAIYNDGTIFRREEGNFGVGEFCIQVGGTGQMADRMLLVAPRIDQQRRGPTRICQPFRKRGRGELRHIGKTIGNHAHCPCEPALMVSKPPYCRDRGGHTDNGPESDSRGFAKGHALFFRRK